ncbi:hypothetical protein F5I97DRAFT_825383 [Phlebopus sp. FC_14]|nr:hypothetical protein F5I97DRAFT_825383 [Phlebopus sp. FC_14]
MASSTYVLLQFGSDPFSHRFEDLESRPAFIVRTVRYLRRPPAHILDGQGSLQVEDKPNLLVEVARQAEWSQQHPDIMGPSKAFLYFGPYKTPGHLIYGNSEKIPMGDSIQRKKESSTSRYFTARSGKELKWRLSPHKMECIDGSTTIAIWELSIPEDVFSARLTIKHAGLSIVTEILTSLSLNRMAMALEWK